MDRSSVDKFDSHERSASLLSTPLPYSVHSTNVTLYPPQPSPLSDTSQTGSYLVPPSLTSPSNCLPMPTQQMYTNYPSPYYRSIMTSQQGYYSAILPTPGHHSSAFYGTFYNPSSPSVYPGPGQSSLNPINYYSTSLYMQNHETMWNATSSPQPNQVKKTFYEMNSSTSKNLEGSLPETYPRPEELPLTLPEVNTPSLLESNKEASYPYNSISRPEEEQEEEMQPEKHGQDLSKEDEEDEDEEEEEEVEDDSASNSPSLKIPYKESAVESEDVDEEDSSSYSSFSPSSIYSCTSDDIAPASENRVSERILLDTSFGDCIQTSRDYAFADQDLQCLLCTNIDHLLPRLDIAIKLEPVVGEQISKSILLCTQCDLMLERYLSMEKEVASLQMQIQMMYKSNQRMESTKEPSYVCKNDPNFNNGDQGTQVAFVSPFPDPTQADAPEQIHTTHESPPSIQIAPEPAQMNDALDASTAAVNEDAPDQTTSGKQDTTLFNLEPTAQKLVPPAPPDSSSASFAFANANLEQAIGKELGQVDCFTNHNCCECGKYFSDRASLNRHAKNHSGKCSYRCDYCSQAFSNKSGWRKHMRLHTSTDDPVLQCQQCSRQFVHKAHYAYHVKVHHGTRDHKCLVCAKSFSKLSCLKTHARIHSGEKPFVCDTCGRGFNVNSNLLAHVPKCSGHLPFKCTECGKMFGINSLFQIHLEMHRGKSKFKCDVCDMDFMKKSHLTAHSRIHTKEKPFTCQVCSKSFANVGNLNSHAKTHINERKFICEICGKKFSRRNGLASHLNRHSGIKPYQCTQCDKSFHDASNLINHCKTHSKNS